MESPELEADSARRQYVGTEIYGIIPPGTFTPQLSLCLAFGRNPSPSWRPQTIRRDGLRHLGQVPRLARMHRQIAYYSSVEHQVVRSGLAASMADLVLPHSY